MRNICFFVGHRDVGEDIYPALLEAAERHITEYGVTEFWVGNYGNFDRLAAKAVREAKRRRPGVTLYLALPYLPDLGRPLPDMAGFDGSIYPEGMEAVPYKLAIPRLNRTMVRQADYVIAYVTRSWGGAAKTLEYAKVRERRGELTITNLGEEKPWAASPLNAAQA